MFQCLLHSLPTRYKSAPCPYFQQVLVPLYCRFSSDYLTSVTSDPGGVQGAKGGKNGGGRRVYRRHPDSIRPLPLSAPALPLREAAVPNAKGEQ